MKSVLRVSNMNSLKDVNKIRNLISQNEGIVACCIDRKNSAIELLYDEYLLKLDDIIDSIESLGYIIV